jgi:hypothetical protein
MVRGWVANLVQGRGGYRLPASGQDAREHSRHLLIAGQVAARRDPRMVLDASRECAR